MYIGMRAQSPHISHIYIITGVGRGRHGRGRWSGGAWKQPHRAQSCHNLSCEHDSRYATSSVNANGAGQIVSPSSSGGATARGRTEEFVARRTKTWIDWMPANGLATRCHARYTRGRRNQINPLRFAFGFPGPGGAILYTTTLTLYPRPGDCRRSRQATAVHGRRARGTRAAARGAPPGPPGSARWLPATA